MEHKISNDLIISVVRTLREIDVRGYDSMVRLVNVVSFFENVLNEPQQEEQPSEVVS